MKRVLLAFDSQNFSSEVLEFVKIMNEESPVLATGIFVPPEDYKELLYSFGGVPSGPLYFPETSLEEDEKRLANINIFKNICEQNKIKHQALTNLGGDIGEQVKNETRFADLLVISSESFYEHLGKDGQEDHISSVLHVSECPVVLVPRQFKYPKNVIIAYDGGEQCTFALRQFSYLFPAFTKLEALLVYFDQHDHAIPQRGRIEDFAMLHFDHLHITKLKIRLKPDLEHWLADYGDTILVSGAYGRTLLSETFKKSFLSDVIARHEVPLFVAHK